MKKYIIAGAIALLLLSGAAVAVSQSAKAINPMLPAGSEMTEADIDRFIGSGKSAADMPVFKDKALFMEFVDKNHILEGERFADLGPGEKEIIKDMMWAMARGLNFKDMVFGR